MRFWEVEAAAFDHGRKVRRAHWSKQVIITIENGVLCIKGFSSSGPDDGNWHPLIITESDWYADDWEVIDD